MSHFTVSVITKPGQSVDDLLAPYDEGLEVEPYIYRTKAEMIERFRNRNAELRKDMESYKKDPEGYCKEHGVYWNTGGSGTKLNDYWVKRLSYDDKSDEEIYTYLREDTDDKDYDEEGNELSTDNPNSKWDWYQIGGRWSSTFKTKDGQQVNRCRLGDLDTDFDEKEYNRSIRFWEVVVEGDAIKDGEDEEDFLTFHETNYYTERYKTKENFAKCNASFHTYSIITPDGKWHEPGRMGWWGVSHASDEDSVNWALNFKKNFIDTFDADYEICLVDCHI